MNFRSLAMVVSAFSFLALGACKASGTGSTGTGGSSAGGGSPASTAASTAAGTGGSATTTTSSTTTSSATGSGGGGTGGAGACDPAETCATAITNGTAAKLCAGSHKDLYTALDTCACSGNCKAACTASLCAGMTKDQACTTCLQQGDAVDSGMPGCDTELAACSNDL